MKPARNNNSAYSTSPARIINPDNTPIAINPAPNVAGRPTDDIDAANPDAFPTLVEANVEVRASANSIANPVNPNVPAINTTERGKSFTTTRNCADPARCHTAEPTCSNRVNANKPTATDNITAYGPLPVENQPADTSGDVEVSTNPIT